MKLVRGIIAMRMAQLDVLRVTLEETRMCRGAASEAPRMRTPALMEML